MAGKISLRRIHLDRMGYTREGHYYGVGPALYEITVDGEGVGTIRASSNYETKDSILKRAKAGLRETSYGYAFRS